jgi:ribonuclease HII
MHSIDCDLATSWELNFPCDIKKNHWKVLVGIDEVGRGCLAGPVVACSFSLLIPPQVSLKVAYEVISFWQNLGVRDSKKLSSQKRQDVIRRLFFYEDVINHHHSGWYFDSVRNLYVSYQIGESSSTMIDKINILQATMLAMKSSLIENRKLFKKYLGEGFLFSDLVLVDGIHLFAMSLEEQESTVMKSLVKGDERSTLIAVASIIAKEWRDEYMKKIDIQYPDYLFKKHKGYGTECHRRILLENGPTPIHRRSFLTKIFSFTSPERENT